MNESFFAPASTVGALGENDTSAIRGGRMSQAQGCARKTMLI